MFERIAWGIRQLVDVRQAIREMDVGADFVADDLGIRRNGIFQMGQTRFDG
ncbi:MAG TPA: hypothetical protein VMW31_05065 [Devosiaceae bacterium]|nr:hypothetical protein [Devosiaceae bacterium]